MNRKKCCNITPSMTCVLTVLSPEEAMQARAEKVTESVQPEKTASGAFSNWPRKNSHPTSWISGNVGNVIKL